MAMYENSKSTRIAVSCANCNKHIIFYLMGNPNPILGVPLCTLKCESDYLEKQKKNKESLTEQTLKKDG